MKKLVFGLIATVMFAATTYAQKTETGDLPAIEFQFGRVSKNCAGIGICKFKINLTVHDVLTIIAAMAKPDGKIQAVMSPEFYKGNASRFQNGYLVVEEDYKIDLETTRGIGVADGYVIKTGKYQVVFDKSSNTYNCTF